MVAKTTLAAMGFVLTLGMRALYRATGLGAPIGRLLVLAVAAPYLFAIPWTVAGKSHATGAALTPPLIPTRKGQAPIHSEPAPIACVSLIQVTRGMSRRRVSPDDLDAEHQHRPEQHHPEDGSPEPCRPVRLRSEHQGEAAQGAAEPAQKHGAGGKRARPYVAVISLDRGHERATLSRERLDARGAERSGVGSTQEPDRPTATHTVP